MLTIKYQTTFKKDYKRIKKRGYVNCIFVKLHSTVCGRYVSSNPVKETDTVIVFQLPDGEAD